MHTMRSVNGLRYHLSSPLLFNSFESGTNVYKERQVLALRYQVYCHEKGFLPAECYPDRLERDDYDKFSTHIVACNRTGHVVGALRVVKPPHDIPFPFQEKCTNLFPSLHVPARQRCIEVSRLVISKAYRHRADDTLYEFSSCLLTEPDPLPKLDLPGNTEWKKLTHGVDRRRQDSTVLKGLFRKLYQYSHKHGFGYWYMAIDKSLARLLKSNFHFPLYPIGEETDYYGPVTPYIISLQQLDVDLSQANPSLLAWLQTVDSE